MSKQNLLLIPGLLSDKTLWDHQHKYLSDLANIIIPDLTGASTPQQMLDKVMKDAPENFALAGHSMGGWLALKVMKNFAHRVTKLCLLATISEGDTPDKSKERENWIDLVQEGQIEKMLVGLTDFSTYNEDTKPQVLAMFSRNKDSLINQEKAMMARQSSVYMLEDIKQATMIIVGREDQVFYTNTLFIAKKIKHAKLAFIEECGHMLTMERPQAVTSLMRFWLEYF